MNAAARVISNTQKSLLRHEELHWLDVTDRVRYKLAVLANGNGTPFATWARSTVSDFNF